MTETILTSLAGLCVGAALMYQIDAKSARLYMRKYLEEKTAHQHTRAICENLESIISKVWNADNGQSDN